MLPSASGLYRAEQCAASCALPQIQTENPDARRGHVGHRFLQLAAKDPAKALEQVDSEHRGMCAAIELDGLPLGPEYRQEVAYAFNLNTGKARCLGMGLERDYSKAGPDDLVGTIDVDGAIEQGALLEEADWKFDGFDATAPEPAGNPQLLFAARCASLVKGVSAVRLRIVHIRSDGSHWEETAEVGAFELDDFEERLRRIVAKVREAELVVKRGLTPNVRQGSWCKYCPAASACPAVLDLLRAAAGEPEKLLALQPTDTAEDLARTITPEIAATAYERTRALERVLKLAKSALYIYAQEHPFEIGEGYAYGPCRSDSKDYDGRITRSVVLGLHGPEAADLACEYSTSEAAIERAVHPEWKKRLAAYDVAKAAGEKPPKPTLSGLKKAAIEAVEKAGGLKREVKVTTKEYRVARQVGVMKATPLPAPAPELPAAQTTPEPVPEPTYRVSATKTTESGRELRLLDQE